ncbi:MAG: plasmid maintenance protein CcdB [Comamonadaceae bacterium]|nr:MAG: plasmid maintenance protein CcdB [Comamonadaceae bacterium]
MARFDVYPHPDPVLRKKTPYLLDVQNDHINRVATRVVLPMRPAAAFAQRMKDLNPLFEIAGKEVVCDTAALAAFPATELKKPVTSLSAQSAVIANALDALFGAY